MALSSDNPSSLKDSNIAATQTVDADIHCGVKKDWKFWCIVFSLTISVLLTAVEFTAIGAALPTIVLELKGEQFIWVGSAYTLGSAALVPLYGGLAQIIGRRPIMLTALVLFALGSTICGAASNMNMLIAGRGLGAGAIASLVQIIFSDLSRFGAWHIHRPHSSMSLIPAALGQSAVALVQSLVVIGSARTMEMDILSQPTYMRLQCYFDLTLMRLKTPPATLREKLYKMDIIPCPGSLGCWFGRNDPLVIYELYLCAPPVVPILLRVGWTGVSGYLQTFIVSMVLASLSYWYPVFFEACKEDLPPRLLPIGGGVGIVYAISLFPILASIPVTQTAPAMALVVFSRNFGYFPQGVEIAFATIPVIPTMSSPLKDVVRDTFGDALRVVWQAVLGMSIAGFLFSLGMRQLELHTVIDEDWGRRDSDVERPDLERLPQSSTTRDSDIARLERSDLEPIVTASSAHDDLSSSMARANVASTAKDIPLQASRVHKVNAITLVNGTRGVAWWQAGSSGWAGGSHWEEEATFGPARLDYA
ncbi:hypothetical protein BGW80DRAFT_1255739 [Lactifluus volemus]|nr:hypothetical protein BGW80DRAFT_1255739 [Lactifluus volemus]